MKNKNKQIGSIELYSPKVIPLNSLDRKDYLKTAICQWHEGDNSLENTSYDNEADMFEAFRYMYDAEMLSLIERGINPYKDGGGNVKTSWKFIFQSGEEATGKVGVSHEGGFNPYNYLRLEEYLKPSPEHGNKSFSFERGVNLFFEKEKKYNTRDIDKAAAEKAEKKRNSYRFEGDKFRETHSLGIKEITKLIREDLKTELPEFKFSVRMRDYTSIDVEIKGIDYNPFTPELQAWIEQGKDYQSFVDNENTKITGGDWSYQEIVKRSWNAKFLQDIDKAKAIHVAYNYDDSDSQTDYFNRGYYGEIAYSIEDMILLLYPETANPKAEWMKEWEIKKAARSEKAKERMETLLFDRYEVAEYDVKWRRKNGTVETVREFVLITRKPNGRSRFINDYNVSILRKIDDAERLKKLLEAESKNKRVWVVYVNGDPYTTYKTVKSVSEKFLYKTTAKWSHHLIEKEKEKEEKAAKKLAKVKTPPKTQQPAAVKTTAPDKPKKVVAGSSNATAEINYNPDQNGIEIKFSAIPSVEIREFLKSKKVRWSSKQKIWYVKHTDSLYKALTEYLNPPTRNVALELAKAKLRLKLKLALLE